MSRDLGIIARSWRRKWLALIGATMIFPMLFALLFWKELPAEARPLVITIVVMSAIAVAGLLAFFYQYLRQVFLHPLLGLARDYEAQSVSGVALDDDHYQASMVAPLARLLAATDGGETGDTSLISGSENWLSEMVHLLDQAVFVASPDHRILLLNNRAREMFGQEASLALGRDLLMVFEGDAIRGAIARQMLDPDGHGERIFCALKMGSGRIFPARLSVLRAQSGEMRGYALTFHDSVGALFRMREVERQFEALLADAASTLSAMQFAAACADGAKAHAEIAQGFAMRLREFRAQGTARLGASWPKGRMSLAVFLERVAERAPEAEIRVPDEGAMIRVDASAMVEALASLLAALHKAGAKALRLEAAVGEDEVKFTIRARKAHVPIAVVEDEMRLAHTALPASPTSDDIFRAHGTEIWPHIEDAATALVFVLPRFTRDLKLSASRPEYYDFALPIIPDRLSEAKLSELSLVVFDCETTGLDPKGGDRVVQISAVRVVNGKVMTSEVFDRLVNPERNIPPSSTKIHGVTEDMVKHAAPFREVLRDFHDFCGNEPLLAHNAAFDMAFVYRDAESAGVRFDQPVLDTVFASAYLFDFTAKHTLDDLAKRFGVEIPEAARHTALGDALATAEVFVRLLPLLKGRGVETLGQFLEISEQMHKIRKQQSAYS